ncbi:hypothetical protein EDB89DRAFT_1904810 [Lactarius sanguifluus]|nr:hypothetical protein EDB89DRAFT_1904810 [Lactarius sanguifluus]
MSTRRKFPEEPLVLDSYSSGRVLVSASTRRISPTETRTRGASTRFKPRRRYPPPSRPSVIAVSSLPPPPSSVDVVVDSRRRGQPSSWTATCGGRGGGRSRGAGGGCCRRAVRSWSWSGQCATLRTGLRAATLNTTTSNSKTATPWATRQRRSDTHRPWHQGDVLPRPRDDARRLRHNTASIDHDDGATRQWDDVNRQRQRQEDANDDNDGSNDGNRDNDNRQPRRQLGWRRALL